MNSRILAIRHSIKGWVHQALERGAKGAHAWTRPRQGVGEHESKAWPSDIIKHESKKWEEHWAQHEYDEKCIKELQEAARLEARTIIQPEEVQQVIDVLLDKRPGVDEVTNKMLTQAPPEAILETTSIRN